MREIGNNNELFNQWLKGKVGDSTVKTYCDTLREYNPLNYRFGGTSGKSFGALRPLNHEANLFKEDDPSIISQMYEAIKSDGKYTYQVKDSEGEWKDDRGFLAAALKKYMFFLTEKKCAFYDLNTRNIIYFGAPGTGKSYKLNNVVKQHFGKRYERVTFYADYLHSQFVGAYKPVVVLGKDNRQIEYQFRPGPFTRVLIRALNDRDNDYALVIEELNRAEAASVFGDVFQLLDRDGNGRSEYAITVSEDLREYLNATDEKDKNHLSGNGLKTLKSLTEQSDCSQIVIPSNMYILATMNSADQGVFPLDTAFKRRWDFEYVGIDDGENAKDENGKYIIKDRDWVTDHRKMINRKLLAAGIPEDKQMGPFFLGNPSLEYGMEAFDKAMKNKVIMYLFEDAAKYHLKEVFNFDSIGKALYPRESPDSQVQTDHYSLSMLFEAWDIINYGIFSGLDSCPDKKDDSDSEGKQGTADASAIVSDGSAQDSNE